MSLSLQPGESCWLLRIGGQPSLASAGELKNKLLEWLAVGKDLDLSLEGVEEIDIPTLQLLCAASREAERLGVRITASASNTVASAILDAGFSQVVVSPVSGAGR